MHDRYVIEAELGEGGMGRVVAAFDRRLERRVALKMLRVDDDCARLLREARAIAAFAHPGIVTIHDVIESADPPCLVMELVTGRTLREVIESGAPTQAQRLRYLCAIAGALAAAHRAGFVHRDLKPENVMVRADDTIKLLDFGLAHRIAADDANRLAGTPGYMAPEQLAGWTVGAAADQYAWGVIAIELLSGVRLTGATPSRARELLAALPPAITEAIAQTVALDPADRFPSMAAVASALGGEHEAPPAREATTRDARPRRRRPWLALVLAAAAVTVAAWPTRGTSAATAHELAPQVLDLEPAVATPAVLRTAGGLELGVLGAHHRIALATIDAARVTTRTRELPALGEPTAVLLTPARYFVATVRGDGGMVLVGNNLADDAPTAAIALSNLTERYRVTDLALITDEVAHTVFALADDDGTATLRVFGGGHAGTAMATLAKRAHPRVVAVGGTDLVDVATLADGVLVLRRFPAGAPPIVVELATDASVPALQRDGERLTALWADRSGETVHRVTIAADGRIERSEVEPIAADGVPQQAGRVVAWSNLDQVLAGCGDSLAAISATRIQIAAGSRAAGPWLAPLPEGGSLVAWLARTAGKLVVHRAIVRCPG